MSTQSTQTHIAGTNFLEVFTTWERKKKNPSRERFSKAPESVGSLGHLDFIHICIGGVEFSKVMTFLNFKVSVFLANKSTNPQSKLIANMPLNF